MGGELARCGWLATEEAKEDPPCCEGGRNVGADRVEQPDRLRQRVTEKIPRAGAATGSATDELAELTAQERKILLLVAEGKTNKKIAVMVIAGRAASS